MENVMHGFVGFYGGYPPFQFLCCPYLLHHISASYLPRPNQRSRFRYPLFVLAALINEDKLLRMTWPSAKS